MELEKFLKTIFDTTPGFVDVKLEDNDKFDEEAQELINVVTDDEMEMVKHLVRKIAQAHKKELPLEGIYSAVAARLADESDKLLTNKELARQRAQKAAKVKSSVMEKFNEFNQSLSDDERQALKDLLSEE